MGHAVVAEQLGRRFGSVVAVDAVDLTVARGEIYGFLGPNGAGKSTMVRMLTTLLLPTSGRATVAGQDVVRDPVQVRLRIGAALQDAASVAGLLITTEAMIAEKPEFHFENCDSSLRASEDLVSG